MTTFVLVHGATAGGWVWKKIAPELEKVGHVVYRPTLTGLGERVHLLTHDVGLDTHIADVTNHILYEDLSDVVLVGHSYGGMVITGVADRLPDRIRALIYFDAFTPQDGEAGIDLYDRATYESFYADVRDQGDGWLIPLKRNPGDPPVKNHPHPWKSMTDRLRLYNRDATASIPRTYVRFSADKGAGMVYDNVFKESWRRVNRGGWRVLELNTVHQISPDPMPKAAVLLKLFPG
jgi:pimeloyl-ACP methyl ester carboxylesterase